MSLVTLIASVEEARASNRNLATSIEAKFNELLAQIESTKRTIAAEMDERDRDLVRLIEGAA